MESLRPKTEKEKKEIFEEKQMMFEKENKELKELVERLHEELGKQRKSYQEEIKDLEKRLREKKDFKFDAGDEVKEGRNFKEEEKINEQKDKSLMISLKNVIEETQNEWKDYFKIGVDGWQLKIHTLKDEGFFFKKSLTDQLAEQFFQSFLYQLRLKYLHSHLEGLEIHLDKCDKMTEERFKILISYIADDLSFLKRLSFKFINCDYLTDQGICDLSIFLRNMRGLKELILYVHDCKQITKYALKGLSKVIQSMENLKELRLFFRTSPTTHILTEHCNGQEGNYYIIRTPNFERNQHSSGFIFE